MTRRSSGGVINATPSGWLAIRHYACCHHRNLLSLGNAVSDKCIQLEPGVVSVVLAFLLRLTRTLRLLGPPDSVSPEDLAWRQLGVKQQNLKSGLHSSLPGACVYFLTLRERPCEWNSGA